MEYLKRILEKVVALSLRVVDAVGFSVPPVVAFILWILGEPMTEGVGASLLIWAGGAFVAIVMLRLMMAPYLVWRDDQDEIQRLKAEISAPQRLAQQRFLEAIVDDRIRFIKELNLITGDIRGVRRIARDPSATLSTLSPIAAGLLSDAAFKTYWYTFEKNMKGYKALLDAGISPPELDASELTADEKKHLARFSFHTLLVYGSCEAMTALLNGEDHMAVFSGYLKTPETIGDGIDLSFARPDTDFFHERQWQGRGNSKPEDWIGR